MRIVFVVSVVGTVRWEIEIVAIAAGGCVGSYELRRDGSVMVMIEV